MTQPKVATGEHRSSEALADQLASASPEALREAMHVLTPEQRAAIRNVVVESTREAAGAAVAVPATAVDQPDQPEQAPKLYSFAEARSYLSEKSIDLSRLKIGGNTLEMSIDDILKAQVQEAIRWGLVDEKDADAYGASFDDNFEPVSGANLQELVRQLKANPDLGQRIVLAVDNMTSDQGWTKLIDDPITRKYVWNRFSRYQRVNPATREVLDDQRPSGKAGILFTPDQMNLPANLRGITANAQLARMVQGQRYMGPVGWMKLFRQGVDRALPVLYPDEVRNLDNLDPDAYKALMNRALLDRKIDSYLLDTVTGTQFPDLRLDGNADGAVPYLCFLPPHDLRGVGLRGCPPANPIGPLGGRPVLGSFLS